MTWMPADDHRHLIRFNEQGWTLQHPLNERLEGSLLDCAFHLLCSERFGTRPENFEPHGDYWVSPGGELEPVTTAVPPPPGTEPCPHCAGTGLRVVPPPPGKRGGTGRKGEGRRHGFESTYTAGCRCDLCTAAHREGTNRRNRKRREQG